MRLETHSLIQCWSYCFVTQLTRIIKCLLYARHWVARGINTQGAGPQLEKQALELGPDYHMEQLQAPRLPWASVSSSVKRGQ